jgi:hypothetical protein
MGDKIIYGFEKWDASGVDCVTPQKKPWETTLLTGPQRSVLSGADTSHTGKRDPLELIDQMKFPSMDPAEQAKDVFYRKAAFQELCDRKEERRKAEQFDREAWARMQEQIRRQGGMDTSKPGFGWKQDPLGEFLKWEEENKNVEAAINEGKI